MGSSKILQSWFPGTTSPFIANAPMFGHATAKMAVAVAQAGGFGNLESLFEGLNLSLIVILGYIGAGFDFTDNSTQISALSTDLKLARSLLKLENKSSTLPIGAGFI